MNSINTALPNHAQLDWRPWIIVGLGLALLYFPTFWGLLNTLWASEQQGHGPIVLGLSVWLIWRRWAELSDPIDSKPSPTPAFVLLLVAVFCYAIGRSQDILTFEVGSLVLVLIAIVVLLRGAARLRVIGFALFFMLFMIPLPSVVIDALTQPMKTAVSRVATDVLHAVGYPVARSGVLIQIGQYRLFVADACAGLHTLFTLEALGLLYLNVVKSSSILRNIVLATLIIPISFLANTIRVICLTLVTYYFGDEAGQGFIHGFAGIVLFLSALILLIAVDSLLRLASAFFGERRRR